MYTPPHGSLEDVLYEGFLINTTECLALEGRLLISSRFRVNFEDINFSNQRHVLSCTDSPPQMVDRLVVFSAGRVEPQWTHRTKFFRLRTANTSETA